MSTHRDIVRLHEIKEKIQSASRWQLLSAIHSLDESTLKYMLFNMIATSRISTDWSEELFARWNSEWSHTKKKKQTINISSKINEKQSKLVSALPTSLGSYVISYCDMYQRIKCKLVCKDFYNYCRSPLAKSHLIIDKKFVESLAFNNVDHREFYHAYLDTIDVNFVFFPSHSSKHQTFGQKQFEIISLIFEKAHHFTTLNWNLTHGQFQSSFNDKYLKEYWWNNQENTERSWFLLWAFLVATVGDFYDNSQVHKCKSFYSVQRINIYDPRNANRIINTQGDADVFRKLFPNITSMIIPSSPCNQHSFFWDFFTHKYYGNTLEYLDIDLSNVSMNNENMNIKKHPLWMLPNMKTLKTLKIKMKMEHNTTCNMMQYFRPLMESSSKCFSLTTVDMVFEHDWLSNNDHDHSPFINSLCRCLLDLAPNVTAFGCNFTKYFIEFDFSEFDKLNFLIGHTDKLKRLCVTDAKSLNDKNVLVPLPSLNKLVIESYSSETFLESMSHFNFSLFPKLESISLIYYSQHCDLNENIVQCLQYLMEQKSKIKHLKYIHLSYIGVLNRLLAETKKNNKKNIQCTDEISEKICKLMIGLNTDTNIETIRISPLFLQKRHYQYLAFWFHGDFGAVDSNIYSTKRDHTYFMDIALMNNVLRHK